jgi:energy-coupling factor transport system permease protein
MHLLTPLVPEPSAPLARANPVAKLAAAGVLLIVLFVSIDGLTALVVLGGALALVPFCGLSPSTLLARSWPLAFAALSIALFAVLFAPAQEGPTIVAVGPIRVGAATAVTGAGLAARLAAIALVGLLATATSDPTHLADALVQQLGVSPRFAIGSLAALRLLPRFALEWQQIELARRARGLDAGRNPFVAMRIFAGQLITLLVAAIRRGTRMAVAMEARGFGAKPCRSVARPQRMTVGDWAWIAGAVLLGAGAVALSVTAGTWTPLLG